MTGYCRDRRPAVATTAAAAMQAAEFRQFCHGNSPGNRLLQRDYAWEFAELATAASSIYRRRPASVRTLCRML